MSQQAEHDNRPEIVRAEDSLRRFGTSLSNIYPKHGMDTTFNESALNDAYELIAQEDKDNGLTIDAVIEKLEQPFFRSLREKMEIFGVTDIRFDQQDPTHTLADVDLYHSYPQTIGSPYVSTTIIPLTMHLRKEDTGWKVMLSKTQKREFTDIRGGLSSYQEP